MSTGPFVPGKTWVGDTDPPGFSREVSHQIRIAGTEATATTQRVFAAREGGGWEWKEQRWVRNVYEFTEHRRTSGEWAFVPGTAIDNDWKPISVREIARSSAVNTGVTYYVPDLCGATTTFVDGVVSSPVPVGRSVPSPYASLPIMTNPGG
jgi:hypothetical protein